MLMDTQCSASRMFYEEIMYRIIKIQHYTYIMDISSL